MSPGLAQAVHYVVLAAGILTWLFALRAHRRAFRPVDPREPTLLREGVVEVPATPEQVLEKSVEALRAGGLGGAGTVLLTEVADRRVAGEITWFAPHGKGGGQATFEVDLADRRASTAASYRIHGSGSSGLRTVSRLFVYGLGPAALAAAAILVPMYALPHADPSVRAQAVQTVQVVHFLWPPFLFACLRKRLATAIETALGNLLRNTAF